MRAFGKRPCIVPGCKAMLSNNIRGRVSHMRAHVRDGEAVEKQGAGGLYWQTVEKPTCVLTTR